LKVQNLDFASIFTPSEGLQPSNLPPFEKPMDIIEKPPMMQPQRKVSVDINKPIIHEIPIKIDRMKSFAPAVEEKNIFRYKIRRRIGRQGRAYIDKIFPEDDSAFKILPTEHIQRLPGMRIPNLQPDATEKVPTKELHDIYSKKFKKFQEVYPFPDSDEDNDLAEFTKILKKNISNSFKNFLKQKKILILTSIISDVVL